MDWSLGWSLGCSIALVFLALGISLGLWLGSTGELIAEAPEEPSEIGDEADPDPDRWLLH